jgi:MerR family copper efflux transcriptional regulator
MVGKQTISALTKRTGVPSKTLQYWESLGLLPKAARSHTGYRLFKPETIRQVEFIQKPKSIGLTLVEVARILDLAQAGRSPCPYVAPWAEQKLEFLQQ